jgi:DNA-binding NarL/FixJ family response regulator
MVELTWLLHCLAKHGKSVSDMAMSFKKSLLLGGQGGHYWLEALRSAMADLDRDLGIASEAEIDQIEWRDYDLVLLDAGVVGDLPAVISQIREHNPEARIIVFSSSPDWKQAREVMLAGGVDYTRKSLDREYISSTLKKNLAKPAPPWPLQEWL